MLHALICAPYALIKILHTLINMCCCCWCSPLSWKLPLTASFSQDTCLLWPTCFLSLLCWGLGLLPSASGMTPSGAYKVLGPALDWDAATV